MGSIRSMRALSQFSEQRPFARWHPREEYTFLAHMFFWDVSSLRILRKHIKRRFNCFKNQGTQTLNCILVSSFVNCVGYSEQFTPSSERPGRPEALVGTTVFVLSTAGLGGTTVTLSLGGQLELAVAPSPLLPAVKCLGTP